MCKVNHNLAVSGRFRSSLSLAPNNCIYETYVVYFTFSKYNKIIKINRKMMIYKFLFYLNAAIDLQLRH